jgi:hypothetical protein
VVKTKKARAERATCFFKLFQFSYDPKVVIGSKTTKRKITFWHDLLQLTMKTQKKSNRRDQICINHRQQRSVFGKSVHFYTVFTDPENPAGRIKMPHNLVQFLFLRRL